MAEQKEQEKKSFFRRLQEAKVDIGKVQVKKDKNNNFANFKFFSLEDFIHDVDSICLEHGIYNECTTNEECSMMFLKIYDMDDENIKPREFRMSLDPPEMKGASEMQKLGGAYSYAKKYLYQLAYDVTSNDDDIDGKEIDTDKENGKKKINKASVMTIKKLIAETNTNQIDFLKWVGTKKVEDITNSMLPTVLKQLEKKKEEVEKAKKEFDKKKEAAKQQEELQKELGKHDGDFEF